MKIALKDCLYFHNSYCHILIKIILKLTLIMELIDTPNPNAKKILTDLDESLLLDDLNNIEGVSSVFFGPGFITISKLEDIEWEIITQEINNIFDKL
tara:strand:- start:1635 stop:1925 length:291 start_codon:yes stop_codon:yes gene_type:complete